MPRAAPDRPAGAAGLRRRECAEWRDERAVTHHATRRGAARAVPTPALSARKLRNRRAAIIGCVGVPAHYGGFETLAEQLAIAAARCGIADRLTIWCSSRAAPDPARKTHHGVPLRHLPVSANGASSILYDGLRPGRDDRARPGRRGAGPRRLGRRPACRAARRLAGRARGERGRAGRGARNGARWRAGSCPGPRGARSAPPMPSWPTTRPSRGAHGAVRPAPQNHRLRRRPCAASAAPATFPTLACRGLRARHRPGGAREQPRHPDPRLRPDARPAAGHRRQLVRDGHGRLLRAAWAGTRNLHLVEAEYDPGRLRAIRDRAWLYLHGHSMGGTNPSLVEMMPFAVPILTWDCAYNRATTAGSAPGFRDVGGLIALVSRLAQRPDTCARWARRWRQWRRAGIAGMP
jgi:hypothetical protein